MHLLDSNLVTEFVLQHHSYNEYTEIHAVFYYVPVSVKAELTHSESRGMITWSNGKPRCRHFCRDIDVASV